jgi:hypothetical protein
MKKLATKLNTEKKVEVKVEVENFLLKVIKKCPKGNYPFSQYSNPPSPQFANLCNLRNLWFLLFFHRLRVRHTP